MTGDTRETKRAEKERADVAQWHDTLLRLIEDVENEHGGFASEERNALGMLSYVASRGIRS